MMVGIMVMIMDVSMEVMMVLDGWVARVRVKH